jgi:hypothetical protein
MEHGDPHRRRVWGHRDQVPDRTLGRGVHARERRDAHRVLAVVSLDSTHLRKRRRRLLGEAGQRRGLRAQGSRVRRDEVREVVLEPRDPGILAVQGEL